jgi:hypothetical protein
MNEESWGGSAKKREGEGATVGSAEGFGSEREKPRVDTDGREWEEIYRKNKESRFADKNGMMILGKEPRKNAKEREGEGSACRDRGKY